MARTKAKAMLIGRLGKDPEMRYTPGGTAITTFSVATDHSYKKGEEWINETDWHNIECWSQLAERVAEKFRKGAFVYIDGNIRVENWTTEDGQKRSKVKIVAYEVMPLEKTQNEDQGEDEEIEIQIPLPTA